MNIYLAGFLLPFTIAIFMYVFLIPLLRRVKAGQSIRKEGPKAHYAKAGTPTMGGVVILLAIVSGVCYLQISKKCFSVNDLILLLMPLLLYGILGFIDDYLIVVKKSNKGISIRFKLFIQILWAALYFYVALDGGLSSDVSVFGLVIPLNWFYGVFILMLMVGFTNFVNFSDGLDGLAAGLLITAYVSCALIGHFAGRKDITLFSLVLVGALSAFFCYNFNPAKIFMGDVGSMALGATLVSIFIVLKMEVLLFVAGFVFFAEGLSVIIQVMYFKITKGKRIFLMSPIHHHFELKGLKENQVDIIFWIAGIISGIAAFILARAFYI